MVWDRETKRPAIYQGGSLQGSPKIMRE
jgi:hypothetical protein